MAFNNGFPVTYPQMYPGYQMPQYQAAQQQTAQMMTPPTIHAEIIQVDGESAAMNYPVGAGSSQMMIARDDSAIYVKTATPNGQATLDVFVKRPQKPAQAAFDPENYVTRDELEKRLQAILAQNSGHSSAKKKEGVTNEPV